MPFCFIVHINTESIKVEADTPHHDIWKDAEKTKLPVGMCYLLRYIKKNIFHCLIGLINSKSDKFLEGVLKMCLGIETSDRMGKYLVRQGSY